VQTNIFIFYCDHISFKINMPLKQKTRPPPPARRPTVPPEGSPQSLETSGLRVGCQNNKQLMKCTYCVINWRGNNMNPGFMNDASGVWVAGNSLRNHGNKGKRGHQANLGIP
jgi:hypothetical protein